MATPFHRLTKMVPNRLDKQKTPHQSRKVRRQFCWASMDGKLGLPNYDCQSPWQKGKKIRGLDCEAHAKILQQRLQDLLDTQNADNRHNTATEPSVEPKRRTFSIRETHGHRFPAPAPSIFVDCPTPLSPERVSERNKTEHSEPQGPTPTGKHLYQARPFSRCSWYLCTNSTGSWPIDANAMAPTTNTDTKGSPTHHRKLYRRTCSTIKPGFRRSKTKISGYSAHLYY